MVKAFDLCDLDGHDKRRRSGTSLRTRSKSKVLAIIGNNESQQKDRDHIEEDDAEEGKANGFRHAQSRILGLANGDTHELGTREGVHSCDHRAPYTKQPALVTIDLVFRKCSRIGPVPEPRAITGRAATNCKNEEQENDTNHYQHLQGRQPKFELAESLNADTVDSEDEDEGDGNEDGRANAVANPELHDESECGELVRSCEEVLEEVGVTGGEAQRRVDEAGCITTETMG